MEKETIKKVLDLFEEDNYVDAKAVLAEAIKKDVNSYLNEKLDLSEKDKSKDKEEDDSEDDDSEDSDEDDEDED
jgi:hypothetical protein